MAKIHKGIGIGAGFAYKGEKPLTSQEMFMITLQIFCTTQVHMASLMDSRL